MNVLESILSVVKQEISGFMLPENLSQEELEILMENIKKRLEQHTK